MSKWIGDRVSFEDDNNITTIIIRPLRVWWKEMLLTLWVLGFTFVGLVMIYLVFTGFASLNYQGEVDQETIDNQLIYGIVFIAFWAYFEFKVLKSLLWYRFGKELIKINETDMSIKKSIFSYGKASRFLFQNIKNFSQRKDENTSFGAYFENAFWALGTDALVFDYFKKTKSFGRRLDANSSRLLLRLIDDRVKKQLRRNK
ncbi:hypothetical protein [Crocinitomix catalasitica]|uniref:hypothetical protein n=1 Tax=Crocinitomix catalasitica TaxID=184607 RepID=UPI000482F5FB|nr:hypothetical protein [Crocinitomix catalasitica]